MSGPSMKHAWSVIETDSRLTNLSKMVLLRCAWKFQAQTNWRPRIKTLARELSATVDGVRKALRLLVELGHIVRVSDAFLYPGIPEDVPENRGYAQRTPKGTPSVPPRVRPAYPLQSKKIKKRARGAVPPELRTASRCYRSACDAEKQQILAWVRSEYQQSGVDWLLDDVRIRA